MALTHLDAGVIIGFLDANDAHHDAARTTLAQSLKDRDHIAMAASALAECLVAPARQGEASVQTVRDALTIATAAACDANQLVTTDRRWPTQQAMKLKLKINLI